MATLEELMKTIHQPPNEVTQPGNLAHGRCRSIRKSPSVASVTARSGRCRRFSEHQTASEVQVRRLSQIADDLLLRANGADALTAARLRTEATRLFAIAFEITTVLRAST